MDTIQINNLTKDYGNNKGVFDISFSVKKGEVFGFLGPNGAGKTTTIRHLMGFLNSDKGDCYIEGLDCRKDTVKVQASLGYIPGETAFMNHMTGEKYINFMLKYRGATNENRIKELISRFDLNPNTKIKKMSKGMKQKVSIVCAFMHDPAVLILDEPTSGLDPLMQNEFIKLIQEESQRGKTILMSSHMFEEVERTCGRVGIIKEGKLLTIDSIESLKKSQLKRFTVTLDTPAKALEFAKENFSIDSIEGSRVDLSIKDNLTEFLNTLTHYNVSDLSQINQSLEDVFLHYYGKNSQGNNNGGDK